MSRPFPIGEALSPFCGVAVMAKASFPGRTKTRLVPPLTFKEAAAFNTAFLQDMAANILAASRTASIRGYMAFGPPDAIGFFKEILPPGISLIEAWLANFGDCLFSAITHLLALGHGAAVVLNSDSPTLPTSLLIETAEVLARPGDCAVLGPSTDGGYYLLGLKAAHRHLFEGIDWSTERVAGQTLQRAREIGLPVHILAPWYDVDELSALTQLCDELFEHLPFTAGLPSYRAQRTTALLQAMLRESDLAHRLGRVSAASVEGAIG